jgi:radical SAM superfamily enzyme YgiQ (UPF0313 family)
MNISLISPYSNIVSVGLRILSACLKKNGHNVKLIFAPKEINEKYTKNDLKAITDLICNSDLVGISLMTNFFEQSVQITKSFKKISQAPVIWGGIHPTVKPEESLEYADIVCLGESEESIVELAQKIEKKEDYSLVKNIGFKNKNGNIILNSRRPLIQNLDSLPFQDIDPKYQYIIIDGKVHNGIQDLEKYWDSLNNVGPRYTTLIGRGCPYNCSYCYNSAFNKEHCNENIFRIRSVDNVIEELKNAVKTLPFIKCIFFNDDHLLGLPKEYIKELCDKYKRYINLPMMMVGVHPTAVDEEKLKYLTNAATIEFLAMGIQAAGEKTKKLLKRNYSNDLVEKAIKILHNFKNKIKVLSLEVIIDNPWEEEKEKIETLMLLSKLPHPYCMHIFSLTLYPGTELYNLAKNEGLIKNELKEIYKKNFYNCNEKLYLNKLFILVKDSGMGNIRIYPFMMWIMTNNFFQKTGLGRILYSFLSSYIYKKKIYKLMSPIRFAKNYFKK